MNLTTYDLIVPEKLLKRYLMVRKHSEKICEPLQTEDYVVQPVVVASPPKWHLGHTTWFFETFVLLPNVPEYEVYDESFNFVFNSYYETMGARVIRTDRGNLSRPSVAEIYEYRAYVDKYIEEFILKNKITAQSMEVLELGLQHEQQHQELLYTDIKFILGHNPLFPKFVEQQLFKEGSIGNDSMQSFVEGIYSIGHQGDGFCFDNELGRHKVFLHAFQIAEHLVSNASYMEFMADGGYENFDHWHSAGWDWVKKNKVKAPLYWHFIDGIWMQYTLSGLQKVIPEQAVCHISYYEASAFASWKGMRLPTEQEWEVASDSIRWGSRWEWTGSAYLPYPNFEKVSGALGEYNGKFMIDQMVLRGGSVVTSEGHSRNTYRNFFQTDSRWQFSGIRLASHTE